MQVTLPHPKSWKNCKNCFFSNPSSFPLGFTTHSNDCACVFVWVSSSWVESPSVLGTLNELGTHATFFTTTGLLSLSLPCLSVSSFLFIALQILYPLTIFLSISTKLPYSSLDKNVDESPWKKNKKPPNKIEIMADVQSARGANQRLSWEKHRGMGVAVVVELVVGGKPGPLSWGD